MLSDFYIKLAKELEVLEPKHPEQVYKMYLENEKLGNSHRENLAHTYVNAFVNCGMKKDALIIDNLKDPWIH